MDLPQHAHKNLHAWLEAQLTRNKPVVFGDFDHTSTLLYEVIGQRSLLEKIGQAGGTLILEGPHTQNRFVEGLKDGSLSDKALRETMKFGYHMNDPALNRHYDTAQQNILLNARDVGAHIFYPEKDTAYDRLAADPVMKRTFDTIASSVTSSVCSDVQLPIISASLSPEEKATLPRLENIIHQRETPEENQKILDAILTQAPPYVIVYGNGHRHEIQQAFEESTSIVVLASRTAPYKGTISDVPEYVYYADRDELVHLADKSPERAAFIAQHAAAEGMLGYALSDAEKAACMAALPAHMRQALPVSSAVDMVLPPPPPNERPQVAPAR